MAEYVLRFSATAFSTTVDDLEQLSAIRGASLALLYSDKVVEKTIKARCPDAQKIYAGASQGVFKFSAEPEAAQKILNAVRTALNKDDVEKDKSGTGPHSQMAYVVDVVEYEGGSQSILNAEALNDLQELQGEGFPLPREAGAKFDLNGDRNRPAVTDYKYGNKPGLVSTNFAARHSYGHKQRKKFYGVISGSGLATEVCENIEDIVADAPNGLPISVKGKIAVFYADGNKLGKAAQAAMRDGKISAFSKELIANQKDLMAQILAWRDQGIAAAADRFEYHEEGKPKKWRFETLLWGGDEVYFVMPAWLAMDFCQMFFNATKDWAVLGKKVTLAAGLVICNQKTPIRQVKAVAKELAEECKKTNKENTLIQIEVFESLSLPNTDLARYRKKLLGYYEGNVPAQISICGDDFSNFCNRIVKLKSPATGLPRSQLYKLLRSNMYSDAAQNRHGEDDQAITTDYENYIKLGGKSRSLGEKTLHILQPIKHTPVAPNYLHLNMLAMLWDYVDPFGDKEQI